MKRHEVKLASRVARILKGDGDGGETQENFDVSEAHDDS